jgi:hypothetical protein
MNDLTGERGPMDAAADAGRALGRVALWEETLFHLDPAMADPEQGLAWAISAWDPD